MPVNKLTPTPNPQPISSPSFVTALSFFAAAIPPARVNVRYEITQPPDVRFSNNKRLIESKVDIAATRTRVERDVSFRFGPGGPTGVPIEITALISEIGGASVFECFWTVLLLPPAAKSSAASATFKVATVAPVAALLNRSSVTTDDSLISLVRQMADDVAAIRRAVVADATPAMLASASLQEASETAAVKAKPKSKSQSLGTTTTKSKKPTNRKPPRGR